MGLTSVIKIVKIGNSFSRLTVEKDGQSLQIQRDDICDATDVIWFNTIYEGEMYQLDDFIYSLNNGNLCLVRNTRKLGGREPELTKIRCPNGVEGIPIKCVPIDAKYSNCDYHVRIFYHDFIVNVKIRGNEVFSDASCYDHIYPQLNNYSKMRFLPGEKNQLNLITAAVEEGIISIEQHGKVRLIGIDNTVTDVAQSPFQLITLNTNKSLISNTTVVEGVVKFRSSNGYILYLREDGTLMLDCRVRGSNKLADEVINFEVLTCSPYFLIQLNDLTLQLINVTDDGKLEILSSYRESTKIEFAHSSSYDCR